MGLAQHNLSAIGGIVDNLNRGNLASTTLRPSARAPGLVDAYIGARMRERRLALNMSQARLGELLDVTFQQTQKYEKGANRVSAARLFDICEALDVSLASMFERELKP